MAWLRAGLAAPLLPGVGRDLMREGGGRKGRWQLPRRPEGTLTPEGSCPVQQVPLAVCSSEDTS